MSNLINVIALERGHCPRQIRGAGEEFTLPADSELLIDGSTWLRPCDAKQAEQFAKLTAQRAVEIAARRASEAEAGFLTQSDKPAT